MNADLETSTFDLQKRRHAERVKHVVYLLSAIVPMAFAGAAIMAIILKRDLLATMLGVAFGASVVFFMWRERR